MRKFAPARVSYRHDFLISYRVYMMTGLFHMSLGTGHYLSRGGGGGLVQIRGGSPFFMQKFKGGPQENMQIYKPIKC